MCEGNCLHCPVIQRGHGCAEPNADEQLALSLRKEQRQRVLAQIAEDTCEKHGLFCCERCFDMEVPADPQLLDSASLERLRQAFSL